MTCVYVLPPCENWCVDQFVSDWNHDETNVTNRTYVDYCEGKPLTIAQGQPALRNGDVTMSQYDTIHRQFLQCELVCMQNADIIWILADWCSDRVPTGLMSSRKVLVTCHHFVPEKFNERGFRDRDRLVDAYHVYNQRTFDFIRPFTSRPIHLLPYWANQRIWHPTAPTRDIRKKHGLPETGYLVGNFQRDTEGHDLKSPKLEKGPDRLAHFLEHTLNTTRLPLHVVLAGWRRQYVMRRLDEAHVPYTYFERPPQPTVNELYQCLDLYAVTARQEGGPQALIECGLTNTPVVSTPVGIAEQVLPPSAINDNVSLAVPAVPDVEAWKIPAGFEPYRKLLAGL